MELDIAALGIFGVSSLAGGGVAWGVVSTRVGDTKKRLEEHEKADTAFHTKTIDRLARIETKIDRLLGEESADGLAE